MPAKAPCLVTGLSDVNSIPSAPESGRRRGRSNRAIRESMRDLNTQLLLLNHHAGGRLDLRGVDLECLDLVSRHGPLSPTALAHRAGLHPATLTGILDRLERGGWAARDRDPADRRGVVVRGVRDPNAELLRLYSGMNMSLGKILAGYREDELELIADYLSRIADAGRNAAAELALQETPR
jgi:DNA-binding MarR family transcriptional regulator